MAVRIAEYRKHQITLLIGRRVCEVVINDEFRKAIPFIWSRIDDLREQYLDEPVVKQRVILGTRVDTIASKEMSHLDFPFYQFMDLCFSMNQFELELKICKSCVFAECEGKKSKAISLLNNQKWTEQAAASVYGNPFEDIRDALNTKEQFEAAWVRGRVKCTIVRNGYYDLNKGIPEECPFKLEHIVSRGQP